MPNIDMRRRRRAQEIDGATETPLPTTDSGMCDACCDITALTLMVNKYGTLHRESTPRL
jgi:hypothetical protein